MITERIVLDNAEKLATPYFIDKAKLEKAISEVTHRLKSFNTKHLEEEDGIYLPYMKLALGLIGKLNVQQMTSKDVAYIYDNPYSERGRFYAHRQEKGGEECDTRIEMKSLVCVPLLLSAANKKAENEYFRRAMNHMRTAEQLLIRHDGSTFLEYKFTSKTSAPIVGIMPYDSNNSLSVLNHSYGIFGFSMAYAATGEEFLSDAHRGITLFWLNQMQKGFDYTDKMIILGACIAVVGIQRMAKLLPESDCDKTVFENACARMLNAVIDNYEIQEKTAVNDCFYLLALKALS